MSVVFVTNANHMEFSRPLQKALVFHLIGAPNSAGHHLKIRLSGRGTVSLGLNGPATFRCIPR